MIVDVLFNLEYDTIKVLNYISYDLYKANDINFAGNKILLFSNTSIVDLKILLLMNVILSIQLNLIMNMVNGIIIISVVF